MPDSLPPHETVGSRGDRGELAPQLLPFVYRELHRIAQRLMQDERSDHTLQATALVHEAYVRLAKAQKRDASRSAESLDASEGDASEGDVSEGDASEGDASEGDASQGDAGVSDASQGGVSALDSALGALGDLDKAAGGRAFSDQAHFKRAAVQAMRRALIDHARAHRSEKRGGRRARVVFDDHLHAAGHEAEQLLLIDDAIAKLESIDEQLARIAELRFFGGATHQEIADTLGTSLRSVERGWRVARAWLISALGQD